MRDRLPSAQEIAVEVIKKAEESGHHPALTFTSTPPPMQWAERAVGKVFFWTLKHAWKGLAAVLGGLVGSVLWHWLFHGK
jgi:hypothetical protein